jgi:homoserine dehydrogenase
MRVDLALVGFGHVGRRFVRLIEQQPGRLLADHDLDCRGDGIATARHDTTCRAEGIEDIAAADLVAAGGSLTDGAPRGPAPTPALDLIAWTAQPEAPARVVVELTTLATVRRRLRTET